MLKTVLPRDLITTGATGTGSGIKSVCRRISPDALDAEDVPAIAEANVRGPSEAAKAAEAAAKQAKINAEAVAKLSDKLKQREGGWFGLFKHMDADGGGEIEFDELEDLVRSTIAPAPSP